MRSSPAAAADFVARYEAALATQDWSRVAPLIHDDASVTFSDGSVHKGKEAVRTAFERNFQTISDEAYRMTDVFWVFRTKDVAVYLFSYEWTGTVNGRPAAGEGRGTSVLIRDHDEWLLVAEHLGRR